MNITRKAKQVNEDGTLFKPPYYMVIDGATPLNNDKKSAALLKTYIIRHFIKIYESERNITKTLQVISQKYYEIKRYKDEKPVDLPSAGIAIVIDHKDTYELFLLGDTSICVLFKDGNTKLYHDDRLTHLDQEAIQIKDKNVLIERLKHNRNLLGTHYDAFIPSKHLIFKEFTYRLKKEDVRKIRLYSDGFSSIMDTFNDIDDLNTFMNVDIKDILKRIKKLAFSDDSLERYPRFKVIDDISVIEIINK